MTIIDVTTYNDPGCPWGYSANPALTTLAWRFGDQLRWRLVLIGLSEDAQQYVDRGYTSAKMAQGFVGFRRFGMPFSTTPRLRPFATSPACRAVVATRQVAPELELAAFRALQLHWFTVPDTMDDPAVIERALATVEGLDAARVVGMVDDPAVHEAYERDRAEARSAEDGPTDAQGKTASTDGPVRYTAPSLVFELGDRRVEAGGFQPLGAYDLCLANLDPSLERRPAPDDPLEVVAAFPHGITTQEVAQVMAGSNDAPDRDQAELVLIQHAAAGRVRRIAVGDDALWCAAA